MNRKNKDWVIVLEDGYPKEITKMFFKEVGLNPYSDQTIIRYTTWPYYKNGFQSTPPNSIGTIFKIPSQWKEAKAYILKEEHILPDTGWLKYKTATDVIIYRTGEKSGYGINMYDQWVTEEDGWSFICSPEDWRPATEEEVKEVLIKQAKKIGYKVGDKIKQPNVKNAVRIHNVRNKDDEFTFRDDIFYYQGRCVMERGQWAEIINELIIDSDKTDISFNKVCDDDSMRVLCTVIKDENKFLDSLKNFEIIIREKS